MPAKRCSNYWGPNMPNNDQHDNGQHDLSRDEEKELSNMLRKVQGPRSPAHVDDAVLRYANIEAKRIRAAANSRPTWLGVNWRSALATCSVAGIALLVVLESVDAPISTEMVTQKAFERASLEQTERDLAVQAQRERQPDAAVTVVEVEEVVVTGSYIRGSAFSTNSSVATVSRPLIDRLRTDDDALAQFINLMNGVLDNPIATPPDITSLTRAELRDNAEILNYRYIALRDSHTLDAASERYDGLVQSLPMLGLPSSLAESMSVLQTLE